MEILTSTGYKHLDDITEQDLLVTYDTDTGQIIYNHLINKERWTHDMLPSQYNAEGELIYTSEEYFDLQFGGWIFYTINDTWTLFHLESIWINDVDVVHVSEVNLGDIIYDDQDQPITVTKIEQTTLLEWWKLTISGDHSYIADNLILHNASRYWVGGGSSTAWNATANTNWASTSGGVNNASVPTSVDDVFFDGAGANGNTNCLTTGGDCLTFTRSSGYTAEIRVPVLSNFSIRGNITISNDTGFTITSNTSGAIQHFNSATIKMGGKVVDAIWRWQSGTKTLEGSNLEVNGVISNSLSCTINKTTDEYVIANGGYGAGGFTVSGNADIYIKGGNLQASFGIANNVYLSGGTITLDNFRKDGNTFKYFSGTIRTLTNTSQRANTTGTIFDTSTNVNYNNFFVTNGVTVRLDSQLNVTGSTTIEGSAIFSGSSGFITPRLSATTVSSATIGFNTGNTYSITDAFFANTSRVGSILTFSSISVTNRANIVLTNGATCNVLANFTRIDASGGRTINTFNGVVTDSINVRSFTDIPTYGSSYVM